MTDLSALEIETERLILRPMRAEDFDGWAQFSADTKVMQTLGGVQPRSVAWRHFLTMAGAWQIQGFSMFSVMEKSSGRWIGRLGPWMPEGWPGPEVGWGIVSDAWGRGYAVEGAIAAIDWAFVHLGWQEIVHCIAPGNRASERVAEKLGSRRLRNDRLPPPIEHVEVVIWGQTRKEWMARQNRTRRS